MLAVSFLATSTLSISSMFLYKRKSIQFTKLYLIIFLIYFEEKKFVQFSTEPEYEKSFEFRIVIPNANTLAHGSIWASNYEHNKKSRGLPIATSTIH